MILTREMSKKYGDMKKKMKEYSGVWKNYIKTDRYCTCFVVLIPSVKFTGESWANVWSVLRIFYVVMNYYITK